MRFYVGITDNDWFAFHAARRPDEVNFWRPKSQNQFRVIEPGALFLFKLHSPLNYIAGGGVFLRHTFLPLALAWEAFLEKNGLPDYDTFRERILHHRTREEMRLQLGCTILVQPFFWAREDWIPIPPDWSSNLVTGKSYDTESIKGLNLWNQVQERLENESSSKWEVHDDAAGPRFGKPQLICPRLGQGAFRVEVTHAYNRRCAITGEKTLPALQAAHIRPYADSGPHAVRNGLLLRSDLHSLFDQGYITITEDLRVEVSRRIREEFENGRHYYAFHGNPLQVVPATEGLRPDRSFLQWHQTSRFLG